MSIYSDYARNSNAIRRDIARAQADKVRRGGEFWGGTLASLGQLPMQILQMRDQQRAAAAEAAKQAEKDKRDAERDELTNRKTRGDIAAQDAESLEKSEKLRREQAARFLGMANEKNWPATKARLASVMGPEFIAGLPDTVPPPQMLQEFRSILLDKEPAAVKVPEPFTLGPGQQRFNPDGSPIASVPPTPPSVPNGFTLGPGAKRFDDKGNVIASVPPNPVAAGAPVNDGPLIQAVIDNPDLFYNLTPTVRQRIAPALSQRGFSDFGPAPSAMERMDARKFEKAGPVLDAIGSLSEKINTQQGVIAKMSGAAERAKASVNLNDDVAEYQALISGFTPLVARALGHTGVLTEQDVQSVKALFPAPGDSKSLRDRKVARLMSIVGQLNALGGNAPAAEAPPPAAPSAPTGMPSYQDYLRSKGQR